MMLFGAAAVAILVWFNLLDKKTHRWRKAESTSDVYAYVAFHAAILLGIAASAAEIYLYS